MSSILDKYKNLIGSSTSVPKTTTGTVSSGSGNPQLDALEKNYGMQSQNALSKYESASKELEKSRDRAVQNAGANNAKLMKYMPSILKRQGLSGLGVSQSAVINASNNFAGQLTEIEDNYQKNSADLLANYNDAKLQYDTQYNTQKAQLEQKALDDEKEAKEKAEAEAKAKNNEIAGNLEAMINGSAATTIDELVSELGITLGEGQDFNAYVDSLGIDAHVASYLKSLAAQKVSANLTASGDKTKAEQEALFEENYKMAYDAIVNDSMTTDFSEYLGQFIAGENISESQLSNLMMLAASQVAKNKKSVDDETKLEKEQLFEDNYKMAYDAIVNDSITTDFSEYLAKFVAGENISESQLSNLMVLAQSQVAKNKKSAEDAEFYAKNDKEAPYVDKLTVFDASGEFDEGLLYLERNKENLSEETYNEWKTYFETWLGKGSGKTETDVITDPNHPNYNQQGGAYDDLTQEQKDDRIIQGLDNIASGGRDYKITSEALGVDSYFLKNPEFVANLAAKGIDIHDTNLNAKQPNNGMVVEFRGRKDGSMGIGEYNIISKYESGEYPHSMRNNYYSAVAPNNTSHIVVYYNGQWYLAEDKGETKKQDISTGKTDPLGVYKPYTVPQYASDSNVLNSIFDKYKQ